MMAYLQLVPLFTAFIVALILLVVMTPLAHQFGLVDQPSTRKRHSGIVPLTGGVAIFMAVLVASVVTDVWMKNNPLFFTASAFIVLLGMLDDRFDLSAKGRLLCQFGVAAIMAWSAQNYITSLGNIFGLGEVVLDLGGYLFTLICVVGVINAFNMIDGIDGLAGGMSLVILLTLTGFLTYTGNVASIMEPLVIAAAIVPFLAFNLSWKGFRGNKIFMGDSGSMFVGLTIVWLLVDHTQGESAAFRPITAVWLVGLPLMDMAAIMYRRARKGQSVLKPDRQHLHNIFMRAGLSSRKSLIAILLLGSCYCIVGILGEVYQVPEAIMFWSFIGVLVIYSMTIMHIWSVLRFIKRLPAKLGVKS
ncbi:undecaprenyl-phosphate alpha-N-acetylglucosaminyl 1-phosphate transferase [Alteromonas sp. KUL42]|jgi:UDP-GlcNAc:undecaprenyl-phosphate GlcNAc-1-phosphate transferase|uniref:UDP-N-acetylglucosamine--undecaprenyl-phosphate N-acetylglucosaminephosphotransferase n=1 Tax=Alteromonas sp. KUL42 TaxID=2480797 RepID=UPI00079B5B39|nr:UDP-N-acetylglucosamine--undecaprenyl-phosphate N-acetylglucosaminephosphotransferase [Alteromonas sp. KUL42]KXJ58184.1 MAG: UDP-phosphate alpha-N-acetylglucosaminyl 1-phosphate transferase [Alteromonas sp. Nap_26]TAP37504.1 undecaprenyl-phosphate alpha-N-acetylglucosaminyl 1-phosphate transferase [Alteromonas sp. KUL42]GEA05917.1 undecaprenyl-phosphate alpha-N-acetylglucosaminyl 1-phosphate transferase [Alteromonas sp. KUL42]